MSAPNISPELSVRDAASITADYIFDLEADTVSKESRDCTKWQSLPTFSDPLTVIRYTGEGEPNITLRIGGDMPDELVVFTHSRDDLRLEQDDYVQFFFERYLGVLDEHEHLVCLRTIAELAQQNRRRKELFQALEERNQKVADSFKTSTKDGMQAQYAQGQLLSWLKKDS